MSGILVLLAFALLLFFLEIFMPGGILAIIGIVLMLIASWLTYDAYGVLPAAALLVACGMLALVLFFVEVRALVRSPLGKYFRIDTRIEERLNPRSSEDIKGKAGVTLTTLAPTGRVRVDGRVYTAVAQDGFLERGTPVQVVRSETFKLIVIQK